MKKNHFVIRNEVLVFFKKLKPRKYIIQFSFLSSLNVILLSASLMQPAIGGEIYSYVDANGVTNFTNKPPKTSRRITVKSFPEEETTVTEQAGIYNCSQSNRDACFTDKSAGVNTGMNELLGSNGNYSFTEKQTSNTSQTRIYKCVNLNGGVAYTDKPPKNSRCKVIYQKRGNPVASFSIPYRKSKVHRKYKNYQNLIQDVATSTQLEPALLHAVIQTESAFNPKAVSPKGAVGLMQLMPATARRFGVKDRTNATANVYGGARYLRYLLGLFNNDLKLVLAAYNAGENAVKRYGNKIPPYRETRGYVKKVMRLYRAYQNRM